MKIKDTFVTEYRAFLTMTQNKKQMNKIPMFDVMLASFIMLLVFVGGALLGFMDNIYYIILACNSLLLISFTLYRVKKEMMFREKNNLDYKLYLGYFYDMILMFYIVFLVNALVLLAFYLMFISIYLIIIFLILGIISGSLYRFVRMLTYHNFDLPHSESIYLIFWMFGLTVFLFFVLNIPDMTVMYVAIFFLTVTLFILKSLFQQTVNYFIKQNKAVLQYLFIGCVGATLLILVLNFNAFNQVSLYDTHNKHSEPLYTLSTPSLTPTIYPYNDLLHIRTEDRYKAFDKDFNKVFDIELEDHAEYFLIDGILHKVTISEDQSNTIQYQIQDDLFDAVRYDLSIHEANDRFQFIQSIYWKNDRLRSGLYGSIILKYDNGYIIGSENGVEWLNASDLSEVYLIWTGDRRDYEDHIYYLDENNIFMVHDDWTMYSLTNKEDQSSHYLNYHNNYVAYHKDAIDDGGICIDTLDEYFNHTSSCTIHFDTDLDGTLYAFEERFLQETNGTMLPLDTSRLDPKELYTNADSYYTIEEMLIISIREVKLIDGDQHYTHTFYQINPYDLSSYTFSQHELPIVLLLTFWGSILWVVIPIKLPRL